MGFLSTVTSFIPGAKAISHIVTHIGKGIREEGLIGAFKVIAKGLSNDWALGLATLLIPGAGLACGIGFGALALADLGGALDLQSEKEGNNQGQPQAPQLELDWK